MRAMGPDRLDGALAAGADPQQGSAALRAEREVPARGGPAGGARVEERIAQQEVRDEAERVGNEERDEGPEHMAHSPSFRVPIHVGDEVSIREHHAPNEEPEENAVGKRGLVEHEDERGEPRRGDDRGDDDTRPDGDLELLLQAAHATILCFRTWSPRATKRNAPDIHAAAKYRSDQLRAD